MTTVSPDRITVHPLSPVLGAEIRGLDLARIDEAAWAVVHDAWLRHSVLLFRDQRLDDADLVAFSRRLGELDPPPVNENGKTFVPDHPEVYVVSNVIGPDGVPIGSLGAGEATWHTDMSYLAEPPDASMLYALEVPPSGGDTWVCSMEAALAALPAPLLERVRDLSIKHDGTYNSGGYLRKGLTATDDPRRSVGTPHPIVCAHPDTGRPVLYLGRRRNAYVIGLPLEESEALLDELWRYATLPAHCHAHRWRVGDLLMWDNRSTMHRRDPFDADSRRVMHRTQIKGSARPRRPAGPPPSATGPSGLSASVGLR
jgi:taurine dioxygenase